jgi:hypothetical protein
MGAARLLGPAHLPAGSQQEAARLLHTARPARARGTCPTLAAAHAAQKAACSCFDELLLLKLSLPGPRPHHPCCCPSRTGSGRYMTKKMFWKQHALQLHNKTTQSRSVVFAVLDGKSSLSCACCCPRLVPLLFSKMYASFQGCSRTCICREGRLQSVVVTGVSGSPEITGCHPSKTPLKLQSALDASMQHLSAQTLETRT